MASAPERAKVTEWLVTFLNTNSYLAGKITAPNTGGWDKDPSTTGAVFTPYTVVTPGTGKPITPSFGDPSQDWSLPYQLTSYGTHDQQIEDIADEVRKLLLITKKVDVVMSDGTWRITTIACSAIGGVGYTTAIEPTAYSQTDSFILTLSRSLT